MSSRLQQAAMDKDGESELTALLGSGESGPLIDLVIGYHETLIKLGQTEKEKEIVEPLVKAWRDMEARRNEDKPSLKGMELLLKDGLLTYIRAIHPHLPPIPPQVVKFNDISSVVQMEVVKGGVPNFLTAGLDLIKPLLVKPKKDTVKLLTGVSGYLMPGTMTLVLGPTGSGKSTLHKVLAGRAPVASGQVSYNGQSMETVHIHRRAAVGFQSDTHLPSLTVRQTLGYAAKFTNLVTVDSPFVNDHLKDYLKSALEEGEDPLVERTAVMLGLKSVGDLPAGSPAMPTLTEDEQHRLTVAELMVGAYGVYFFDQISKTIDWKATYEIISMIREFAQIRQVAVMCSLLRPTEAVCDLFDRVILLSAGKVLYQGPMQDAAPYFAAIGYAIPDCASLPEFLQEVGTDEGAKYLQPGFQALDLNGFEAAYKASPHYRDIQRVVTSPEPCQQIWTTCATPIRGLALASDGQPEPATRHSQNAPSHGHSDSAQYLPPPSHSGSASSHSRSAVPESSSTADVALSISGGGSSAAQIVVTSEWGKDEKLEARTGCLKPGDRLVGVAWDGSVMEYVGDHGIPPEKILSALEANCGVCRLQFEHAEPPKSVGTYKQQFEREYVMDFWPEFWLLLQRQRQVLWGNKFVLYARLAQVVIMGLFNALNFFRMSQALNTYAMNLRRGLAFASLVSMTLSALGQLPAFLEERAVFYKQTSAKFFRPGTYLLAHILAGLPYSLGEATVWTVLVYFISNWSLADGGWQLGVWLLAMYLTVLNSTSLVRLIAFAAPTPVRASLLAGIVLPVFILFAHFLIASKHLRWYVRWIYYADWLQYSSTMIMVAEFRSGTYAEPCAQNPQLYFCKRYSSNTVGLAYLKSGQWNFEWYWFGIGPAVMILWIVLFNLGAYYCMTPKYFRHLAPKPKKSAQRSAENQPSLPKSTASFLRPSPSSQAMAEREASTRRQEVDFIREDEEWAARPEKFLLKQIPFTRILLSWHSLSYEVVTPGITSGRALLKEVSGWAEPGKIVALVGAPGAGKTTLLHCLAGRKVSGRLSGQILVNGKRREMSTFLRWTGYVERADLYPPYLTVRENLSFRAVLGLPRNISKAQRMILIDEILDCMEIRHLANTMVGQLAASGNPDVSKRISVAMELAGNPGALFLDAPFQGLDSQQSIRLQRCLDHVAEELDRTVVLTSTLPCASMLAGYWRILILRHTGEMVYFGPSGDFGIHVLDYFRSIPGTPPPRRNQSTMSHALTLIGDGITNQKAMRDFAFEYRISDLARENSEHLAAIRREEPTLTLPPPLPSPGPEARYSLQAWTILVSLQKLYWRNTPYTFNRFFTAMVFGLLLGAVFFDLPFDTTTGMAARAGFVLLLCYLGGAANAAPAVNVVASLKRVYMRERSVKQYSHLLYNVGFSLAEIPYTALTSLAFAAVACGMANVAVDSAAHFLSFWFTLFLLALGIVYLGLLLAVAIPRIPVVAVVVPMLTGAFITASGYILPKHLIKDPFVWCFWINPLQYALNTMTIIALYCDTRSPECSVAGCATDPLACPACMCPRLKDLSDNFAWDTIKMQRRLDTDRHMGIDWLFLLCFIVTCRCATLLSLRFMKHNK